MCASYEAELMACFMHARHESSFSEAPDGAHADHAYATVRAGHCKPRPHRGPVQAETALTAALSACRSATVTETSAYSVKPHSGFTRRDMRLKE